METYTLTRQAVARLCSAPVETRVINGTFKRATVVAKFSRYTLEMRFSLSNPALEWASGPINYLEFVLWKGSEGCFIPVPSELMPLVSSLRKAAEMTPKEVASLTSLCAS